MGEEMREIKFRAWDKIDKKMRIVTRITFGLEPTGHPAIIVHLDDGKDPVTRSINDVVLLQYTGFKDKNGKEIYESDITNLGLVAWVDDEELSEFVGWHIKSLFKNKYNKYEYYSFWAFNIPYEIDGNIFENPELMEGK